MAGGKRIALVIDPDSDHHWHVCDEEPQTRDDKNGSYRAADDELYYGSNFFLYGSDMEMRSRVILRQHRNQGKSILPERFILRERMESALNEKELKMRSVFFITILYFIDRSYAYHNLSERKPKYEDR